MKLEYCPSPHAHEVLIRGRILAPEETPQQMFERVIETLFAIETVWETPKSETRKMKAELAEFMAQKALTPGTPTLTNAGRPGYEQAALCSCALIPVDLRQKQTAAEIIRAYYCQNMGIFISWSRNSVSGRISRKRPWATFIRN